MMEEIWRNIKQNSGYEISNYGRVKSLNYRNTNECRILKPYPNKKGYLQIRIGGKMYRVHRLVAEAFIPNTENKPYIDHINTIKDDNRVENLRWCTAEENINNPLTITHISNAQKGKRIEKKLKPIIQYDKNGYMIKIWSCATDIENELNINRSNISKQCKGLIAYYVGGYNWKYYNTDNYLIGKMNNTLMDKGVLKKVAN